MGINNEIFSKEEVGTLLLKFSVPAVISLLVAELYNMVDTIFVGRTVGASGISALIIAFPIQRLIIAISMMIAIGAATSVAKSFGKKDMEAIKAIIQNAIGLVLVLLLPIIVIMLIFKKPIIMHLGASPATFNYANDYIGIVLLGSLFQCFTLIGNQLMISFGNTKVTLISTLIGALSNIVINYILVILFPFEVKGSAIATVISQALAFTCTLKYFFSIKKSFKLSFKLNFKKSILFQILLIGFTTFVIEVEDGLVVAILNNLLASSEGDIAVTILGIILKISMFMYITIIGISSSMQPIVAFNFGACHYKKLKEVVKKTIVSIFSTSLVVWVLAFIFSKELMSMFIADAYIIEEASKSFRLMISAYPLLGLYYVAMYYNQAVGKAKLAFYLSICKQILMVVPLSYLFIKVFHLGSLGVWISYPIADALVFLISLLLLKKWELRINLKIKKTSLATS